MQTPTEQLEADARIALSITEAGRLSSLGRTTIYQLIKENEIPTMKVRRRRLIMREDLLNFLKAQRA